MSDVTFKYKGKTYTEAKNAESSKDSERYKCFDSIIQLTDDEGSTLSGLFHDKDLEVIQLGLVAGEFKPKLLSTLKVTQMVTFLLYRFNVFDLQMGIGILYAKAYKKGNASFYMPNELLKMLNEPKLSIFKKRKDKCGTHVSVPDRINMLKENKICQDDSLLKSVRAFGHLRNVLVHPLFKQREPITALKELGYDIILMNIYEKDMRSIEQVGKLILESWYCINQIKHYVCDLVKN
ncbi:MAG: hypothetical protein HYW47_01770 [Deltaproteobacteria bacterium]|nr:hypothetical protein [Deltaproteobacteria bacterium]